MTILVTGATGHLGNVLVRELLARGETVRALVLPGDRLDSLRGLMLEVAVGSVLEPATLERAMRGVKVVYHLAGIIAIRPGAEAAMRRVNVEGARSVAGAALLAGVERMVHVSSIHAFRREPHGVVMDETVPFAPDSPAGAYDRTKAEGTLAVLEAVREGLDAVVACPTGIIGPHDYLGSEMGRLLEDFARPKPHFLVRGAFDFVDVRDVARGLILASEKGRPGEAYILAGNRITLDELRRKTQAAAGVRSPVTVFPLEAVLQIARLGEWLLPRGWTGTRFTSYALQTVADNCCFSSAKAVRELGYRARPVEESVADFLAWHGEQHREMRPAGKKKAGRKRGALPSRAV